MRVVQIIDSLHVGGAERMAVNYANSLAGKIELSGLVTSRKEGELKSQLKNEVGYLFLKKKRAIDARAILRLRSYCKTNQIDFVHAHGTSFFLAFLLKIIYPKVKIVWHEHKGARSAESLSQNRFLWICSHFFAGIIVVDHQLEKWCKEQLKFKNVIYLPNFTLFSDTEKSITQLKGESGKRIVSLANLRIPKNHQMLVRVAARIKAVAPEWTFHLIGNDFDDTYSKTLKAAIKASALEETVYIYGLREDTAHIIEQADIAVLTSISEGLPVALLEYGLHRKAVVATHVGEIPLIINNEKNGYIVAVNDDEKFAKALLSLIENTALRNKFGEALYETIMQEHSEQAVIGHYLEWLNKI